MTESGDDFEQAIRDGMDGWTIKVLQQTPGNLVLLTRSSGMTALNVYVYQLQSRARRARCSRPQRCTEAFPALRPC